MCYAFSLPPTAFVRQQNRATADTAQDAATAEGLAPLMGWVKRLADHVIQELIGEGDLEFAWADATPADPAEQAKTLDLYVRGGIYTVNEARDALGLDPIPGGDAALVYGTQGPVPLDNFAGTNAGAVAGAKPSSAPREGGNRPLQRIVGDGRAGYARAEWLTKDYDPDEPRVPAGDPDGGEWTSGGDGGSDDGGGDGANEVGRAQPPVPVRPAGEGSSSEPRPLPTAAAGGGPAHDVLAAGDGGSQPPTPDNGRVWERFPNADFRNRLAIAEGEADKPNFGYQERNPQSGALGRYQMLTNALQAAGMIDANGNWTGKYGIRSPSQFLASPVAQEQALTDYLNDIERQLRANGSFDYVGTVINGRVAPFTVTIAGLIAAGHREGAGATVHYLGTLEDDGFQSGGHPMSRTGLAIETRLRTFSGVPYE